MRRLQPRAFRIAQNRCQAQPRRDVTCLGPCLQRDGGGTGNEEMLTLPCVNTSQWPWNSAGGVRVSPAARWRSVHGARRKKVSNGPFSTGRTCAPQCQLPDVRAASASTTTVASSPSGAGLGGGHTYCDAPGRHPLAGLGMHK